ncbi:MAG: glycosyltransferase family 87 protein [Ignavibacteriaceae bacterium]
MNFKNYLKIINAKYEFERLVVAIIASFVAGLAIVVGLMAVGVTLFAAILISILFVLFGVIILTNILPTELIGINKQKPWLSIVWLLTALAVVIQINRLSIFMINPSLTKYSILPNNKWLVEHCCLTAYSESARLTSDNEKNIYDQHHYLGKTDNYSSIVMYPTRQIENFNVDLYHYPPQFLLLPLMGQAVTGGDFLHLRMLWFAMSVLSLLTAIGFIISRLEPKGRMRMIGMAPLLWVSMPVLVGIQMSNVQIIVISVSIIAMSLFPINKSISSLFLAMTTVAKIFPGILIVYLVAQKKFRKVLLIAGFAILLSIATLIVVGPNPFQAFIEYEMPKLSSGEAFLRPFSKGFAIARNMAPFGIPLKLGWLGLPGMTLEIGRIVSSIYLLMVLILAIWSGKQKPRSNSEMVSVWISLICLASLVSPFAPASYVLVSVVLLVCLNYEFFRPWAAVVIWLFISLPFLMSQDAPFIIQALCYLPSQVIAIGVPGFILYRAGLKTKQKSSKLINTLIVPQLGANK